LYYCDSDTNKRGVTVDSTGVAIFGGIIQHNESDVYLTGPVSYFLLEAIRSEGSARFVETLGGGTRVIFTGSIRDCTFHCDGLHPDGGFISWNFSGQLILDNVHALNWDGVGISPRVVVSPTVGLSVDARGLSLDGTEPKDAVAFDALSRKVSAVIRGYSQLSGGNIIMGHFPGPTLLGGGTLTLPTSTILGPATVILGDWDYVIRADTTAGLLTLNLPAAATCSGRVYLVKRVTGGSEVVIAANGAEAIDGSPSRTLTAQYESLIIQSNGGGWDVLSGI
jgi:hypothetical protein